MRMIRKELTRASGSTGGNEARVCARLHATSWGVHVMLDAGCPHRHFGTFQ